MNDDPLRDEALSRAVRGAFSDLNRDSVETLSALSASRRLQMVADLADFARASYRAQARMARPGASSDEIEAMVCQRMLERHDVD